MFRFSSGSRLVAPAPALAALCAFLAPSPAARAQGVLDTIQQPDSQPGTLVPIGSSFGDSVAIAGRYAVVGEPGFQVPGLGYAGRIVVLERDVYGQWSNLAVFAGSLADGNLGHSVDIASDSWLGSPATEGHVIAGAPSANRAQTFTYDVAAHNWNVQTFAPPAGFPSSGDYGWSVATNGIDFFIGQPNHLGGYVHGFWRDFGVTWNQPIPSRTEPSAAGQPGQFGYALALNFDDLVVGAPGYTPSGGLESSAFVYHTTGIANWPLEQRIPWVSIGGIPALGFGKSVALDGNRCVIGAPDAAISGLGGAGRALAFTRAGTSWSLERVYLPAPAQSGAGFGSSVALDGSDVAIGVPEGASGQGRVRVYEGSTNGLLGFEASPPTPSVNDRFGGAVAFERGFLLVGDPGDNGGRGSVFEYSWDGPDCNANGLGDLYDFLNGTSVDTDGDAVPDECQSASCQLEKLIEPSSVPLDRYGWSVATDGARVISGAYSKASSTGVPGAGAASVFRRDGTHLVPEALLVGTNIHADDGFGTSVAIFHDLAFVGAPGDDTAAADAGALYVFRRASGGTSWMLEAKLVASDATVGAALGASVAYSDDTGALAVGASNAATPAGPARGAVYVYVFNGSTWTQRQKLYDPLGAAGDAFGFSVAIHVTTIAIGAPRADPSGVADAGVVLTGIVAPPFAPSVVLTRYAQAVPLADSWLGHSVAVHLGLVAAGAPHDPTRGFIAGSVQICHGGTSPLEPVYLSGGNDWDSFGTSLTWANDLLVVGAPFIDTTQAAGAGQACFFRFFPDGTHLELSRVQASDGNPNQAFGNSVGWSSGLLAVGAYGDDVPNGTDSGSAYAFGLGGADCNSNLACDLCDIRAGTLADIGGNGVPDVCELSLFCFGDGSGAPCPCGNTAPAQSGGCKHSFGLAGRLDYAGTPSVANDTFVFTASDLPATSTALFFQGTGAENQGAGATFADGVRCVTGSLVRLRTRVASAGVATYPIAGDPLVHVRGSCVPGDTRYYQVNYRNSASTFCTSATMNYTNGVAAVWQP